MTSSIIGNRNTSRRKTNEKRRNNSFSGAKKFVNALIACHKKSYTRTHFYRKYIFRLHGIALDADDKN